MWLIFIANMYVPLYVTISLTDPSETFILLDDGVERCETKVNTVEWNKFQDILVDGIKNKCYDFFTGE